MSLVHLLPVPVLFFLVIHLTPTSVSGLHPCPVTNETTNVTHPCFPPNYFPDPRYPYGGPPMPPHMSPWGPPPPPQPWMQPQQPPPIRYVTTSYLPPQPPQQVHFPPPQTGYSYPPSYQGPQQYLPRMPVYGYPVQHQYQFMRRSNMPAIVDKREEPVFLKFGTVQIINGRDVEMTCSFHDPKYKVVSNVVWVKVTGPYDHFLPVPPFECRSPGCQYEFINSAADFRYRVMTLGTTSVLRIYDIIPQDFGIYRCAATGTNPEGQAVTLYQVVQFMRPSPFNMKQ